MQTFIDPVAQQVWEFENDVAVAVSPTGVRSFTTHSGQSLSVPTTLVPYVKPAPTAAQLLADAQAARITYIDQQYETLEHANIAYLGTTFQADDYSQDLIARVLLAQGGTAPAGFGWYDVANTKILMTNAQLQGLANAIYARNEPLFNNKQTKKATIRAATTVAAVQAVIW